MAPEQLFEVVARAVWVVVAAQSEGHLGRRDNVALGSAVAITDNRLVTNCHVIEQRPFIWLKQGDLIHRATVVAGDADTDRCVLASELALTPVPGVRAYDDLRVGEAVFSVGSPRGLEQTLGQGIISGLRVRERQRLVQTSAPISRGSSGGGLFDRSGNLVGITTFAIRDSPGLNFAIAAEDYFR